ncbi:MAG: hypothetical protein CVV47_13665 [Spirochaetae bacterium HGW-Spirochaetae-3]|jgi:tetratricopeptide (TPR) repeat protein|nr:MAG: hypothetical protein CVV47_13665 [Spirochaetae bacterium HGW-Spirochaetae-3]
MKSYISKILLVFNNNTLQVLEFKSNKINIITGNSGTGKTTIMNIVDYCLFSSHSDIPERIINENVAWYGMQLQINEKLYLIMRGSPTGSSPSGDYYFSANGEVPSLPVKKNISGNEVKKIIEAEFRISSDVAIPFGGKQLKKGSQVSLRYFLLFCMQDNDIIASGTNLYIKQNDPKYIEAIKRIYDLAIGVETISNLILKTEIDKVIQKLADLIEKKESAESSRKKVPLALVERIKVAKEMGMVLPALKSMDDLPDLIAALKREIVPSEDDNVLVYHRKVSNQYYSLLQDLRNLQAFKKSIDEYKQLLKMPSESLQIIEYIREHEDEILETSVYGALIEQLEKELNIIKTTIKHKSPIDLNLQAQIKEKTAQAEAFKKELENVPSKITKFEDSRERDIFIGEIKAYVDMANRRSDDEDLDQAIEELIKEKDDLVKSVIDVEEEREKTLRLLEELFDLYWQKAGDVVSPYTDYRGFFVKGSKDMRLKRPMTDTLENVGSSSNHLFRHLCYFLAFHDLARIKDVPFVLPILILDQPSRPFFASIKGNESQDANIDPVKIRKYFQILDDYITDGVKTSPDWNFQVIILEHISVEEILSHSYKNINIVADFSGGEALVPKTAYTGI